MIIYVESHYRRQKECSLNIGSLNYVLGYLKVKMTCLFLILIVNVGIKVSQFSYVTALMILSHHDSAELWRVYKLHPVRL